MGTPGHHSTQAALPVAGLSRLGGPQRRLKTSPAEDAAAQLIENLRQSQAELEIQNQTLRFSQAASEGASERFVTLFSNVPLALMVVDERGQILENNARALDLLRPLETDPPLTYLFPLVRPPHVARVMQGFVTAANQGTCELNELEFSSGSNGVLSGDLHIARIDNIQDEGSSFICAIIDQGPLLKQRHALQASAKTLQERNEALYQSQTRLSAIIDSSLDVIICVDALRHITVFNPAAAALFKCPTEQALGLPLSQFLPDAEQALAHIGPSRHAQLGEMSGITHLNEPVPLEVSLSLEQHDRGDIITLFARDLTAAKKMEAHRATLEGQLRESQKMQAIGTMAGGIAHDFNNIISAILGNVVLARQDVDSTSPVATSLGEIDKAGRRARDLVRQILTFSRNEPPRRVPLQLADVVNETLRLVRVTLPPQVKLQLNLDPTTPPVMADATQIEQVLLNLCTNAIHAIGQQPGSIRIELTHSLLTNDITRERRIGLRGQHIRLSVNDSGCGMDAATLARVFEPFFTTKPVGQGTGLGLSVVHGIMRAHAGEVQVDSTPDRGSEFTLFFPISDMPAAKPVATCAPESSMGCGQRVMYVDDDEALVFLVKRLLTRKGYQVIAYTDPRQAAAALRADPMQCDLLVTDFNMPGYSGVDLLRDVRDIRPTLPVALASGYVTPEIERDALAAGARALIHKPNDVDELCTTVQLLLQQAQAT
jgi:two-component system cell cycle sensor histidine kinase/response regulator CckA